MKKSNNRRKKRNPSGLDERGGPGIPRTIPSRFQTVPPRMTFRGGTSFTVGGAVAAGALAVNTYTLNSLGAGSISVLANAYQILPNTFYQRYRIHGVALKVDVVSKGASTCTVLIEPSVAVPTISTQSDLIKNGALPGAWLSVLGVSTGGNSIVKMPERYYDFSSLFGIKKASLSNDEDYSGDSVALTAPTNLFHITFAAVQTSGNFLINTDPVFQVTAIFAMEYYEPITF